MGRRGGWELSQQLSTPMRQRVHGSRTTSDAKEGDPTHRQACEADWVSQGNIGALNAIIKNLVFAYLTEETKEGS